MIEERILELVKLHYEVKDSSVLLLSELGVQLSEREEWPRPNESRSLIEIADGMSSISLVRDENAKAYIAVVLVGDEQRAYSAIEERRKRRFLRALPYPLVLAFTVEIPPEAVMSVKMEGRVTYKYGANLEEGFHLVDPDLRLPGVDLSDLSSLSSINVELLETNIREWFSRHQLDPSRLQRQPSKVEVRRTQISSSPRSNALERLYAAQEPDIAQRLTIPMDIALALSRIP